MANFGAATQAALEALQTGGDIDSAVATANGDTPEPVAEPEDSVEEDSTISTELSEGSDNSVDVEVETSENESQSESIESKPSEDSIVEVKAGGKKLKVDFNDREKLTKYVKLAMGARQWQAERDQSKQELAKLKEQMNDLKDFESTIETAWANDGIEGLIKTVSGDEDSFSKYMDAYYEKRRAKEDATPDQLERLELQEALEKREQMLNRMKQEQESNSKKAAEQAERAEIAKLQNLLTPAFNKYRFSGKLGDAEAENNIDSAIYARAKQALAEIPDEVELTAKIVDREFRKVANSFRKYVQSETKKKVTKAIKNKQAEAAKKVALATGSTPAEASNETKAKELLKQGKGREALMAFLGR